MATNTNQSRSILPISTGFEELVSAALADINTLSIEDAIERLTDEGVVFVDVRDGPELESDGKIPNAVHASRGMLEFHVDPESPYHLSDFVPGKEFVLYCSLGSRSALSAQRLQEMGVDGVTNLKGGFAAWKEAGGPVEEV